MKDFFLLLIDSLRLMLEISTEKFHIIKYATTNNAWLSNSKGLMGGFVMYNRLGRQEIRRRPAHYNIKNPDHWQGRWNYFKAYLKLTQTVNFELARLYELKPERKTYFNLLLSQISKFWTGGPTPAPYSFSPGTVDVTIGNGTMPDTRDVTFTASAGGHLLIKWDPTTVYSEENADDILQVMLITGDGSFGLWHPICAPPLTGMRRTDGASGFDWIVPDSFLTPSPCEAFCAIKFQSGTGPAVKHKGNFRFPVGIMPITLIP